jgi:alkylmercury lyase
MLAGEVEDEDMSVTTDLLVEYAEQAGLSITSVAQAKLEPRTRTLHRAVLRAFLDTGTGPSSAWLRELAVAVGLDPDAALVELAGADLVHVGEDVVVVAYPFSGVPTNDQVQLESAPPLWAMCAIDALGILLMTGRDGVVTSSDPQDGQPIRVERRGTHWFWTPESTVVLVGAGDPCGHAAESACPHMAFHADAEGAEAYLRTHPDIIGFVLDHPLALEVAEFIFGSVLDEQDEKCERDSAVALLRPGDRRRRIS